MRLCVLFCLFLHFILNVNSYEVTKLTGHTDKIVGLALHTKSGVFASVSHDKTVKVWDIKSEKLLRSFTGFNSWVESISISPNGKNIIVGLWDGEIRILDITTGKMLKSLQYHQGSVKVLEFSADESVFVSAGDDGIIRIWNSITWELMTTLKGHNYSVSSVKFSDNGRLMITSSIDETIKIWDIDTKKCLNTLKGHKAMVTNAFFVDDEKYIVSTSVDKTIKIWDWKSNKLIQSIVAHSAPIYASNYFKTQNQITTTSEDGSIKIWQYPAMEQIDSFNMKSRAIFTLVLDSNVIITAGIDSAISMIKKTHRDDLISSIKNYVEMKINTWQKKGEYEKIADYQNRVSVITRQKMIQEYTDEAIAIFKKEYLSKLTITEMKLGSYDADNESYLLSLSSKKSVALKVPLAEAKSLKEHWDKVIIAFADATIVNDFFEITKITFRNSITNKTYSYDSNITTKYVASNIQYNFDDIKVNVSSDSVSTKSDISVTTVTLGKSDVSINIPVTKTTNPDAIAVIIGNKDYKKTKAVDFALNDAQLMKEYLIKIFGYKEGNIFFVQNANKGDFEMYFGNFSKTLS